MSNKKKYRNTHDCFAGSSYKIIIIIIIIIIMIMIFMTIIIMRSIKEN